MKKLLLVVFSLMLLGIPNAHARNSAATYDNKYWSQQEFVAAYNNTTVSMYRDYIVGLDTNSVGNASPSINPNNNLGQYITENTGSTTDNLYVFGVVDETIPAGQLGRVCIRGPHKVVFMKTGTYPQTAPSVGTVLSQCSNNSTANIVAPGSSQQNPLYSTNGGLACTYSTSTGTAGGMLGWVMSSTATTDTGDAGQTVAGIVTTESEYWTWITPQVLR